MFESDSRCGVFNRYEDGAKKSNKIFGVMGEQGGKGKKNQARFLLYVKGTR
jgi:hypothetical protein